MPMPRLRLPPNSESASPKSSGRADAALCRSDEDQIADADIVHADQEDAVAGRGLHERARVGIEHRELIRGQADEAQLVEIDVKTLHHVVAVTGAEDDRVHFPGGG